MSKTRIKTLCSALKQKEYNLECRNHVELTHISIMHYFKTVNKFINIISNKLNLNLIAESHIEKTLLSIDDQINLRNINHSNLITKMYEHLLQKHDQ